MNNLKSYLQFTAQLESNTSFKSLDTDLFVLFFSNLLSKKNNLNSPFFIITANEEESENVLSQFIANNIVNATIFPSIDTSPYSKIVCSHQTWNDRLQILSQIILNPPDVIITSVIALTQLLPPLSFIKDQSLTLKVSDIISSINLAQQLQNIGYYQSPTVEEKGTFAKKGEVFDIFPIEGDPVRISYWDDMIEEIYFLNVETGLRDTSKPIKKLEILASVGSLLNRNSSTILHNFLDSSTMRKHDEKRRILNFINEGIPPDEFPHLIPLLFDKNSQISDFFQKNMFYLTNRQNISNSLNNWIEQIEQDYLDTKEESSLPDPSIFFRFENTHNILNNTPSINDLELKTQDLLTKNCVLTSNFLNLTFKSDQKNNIISGLALKIAELSRVVFIHKNKNEKEEIEHLLNQQNILNNSNIHFQLGHLDQGRYFPSNLELIISSADIFGKKAPKRKSKSQQIKNLFAEQLSTLKEGDFVVHADHGLGKYLGLQRLTLSSSTEDFVVLEYDKKDKIYVPFYKLDLLQKYSDGGQNISVANLRTNKFQTAKEKARDSAKKLAFNLLELNAKRKLSDAFAFSPPDHFFKEFELAFPYTETLDQASAIEDVIINMQKNEPMDHLVCGDVGFGKTEVAMRAAYKAALDSKQVAILVPTTILALQHYNSFKERFKDFPVQIEYISRLQTPKKVREIEEKTKRGEIDILIGTHKILSSKLEFKNIGLVIVDEEQRFGVAHKEKLKLMKSSVDFLTLTATPIPRTLQMAFLGIRDLSIIQTPPPRRQSIKTYVVRDDPKVIQDAIKKELSRNGQVFYVHNKVMDLDRIAYQIKELVPEANIIIGHGQLNERELEKRIQSFYQGKYNILLCTTIIESGIDIPRANTMIIERADCFGLSQLHQLRGRIGRSDKKAYAYFMIPEGHSINEQAQKRLQALTTHSDIGSGFSLASCDLDIRGAGDLLGAEQSGHVDAIGLELYMNLLQDAISELTGKEREQKKILVEISTPFNSYIPENYISDNGQRLKEYKVLSQISDLDILAKEKIALQDAYGNPPDELNTLLLILESRIRMGDVGITSAKIVGKTIHLKFSEEFLTQNNVLRDKLVKFLLHHKKQYQFSPNFKVSYNHKTTVDQNALLTFVKDIVQHIKA